MSKFSSQRPAPTAPIQTLDPVPTTSTFEGAPAYSRDARSELFLLAVTNMVSEKTFYEPGKSRDQRFSNLIHEVTRTHPEWMRQFVPWLRKSANMRSAPIVALAEYTKAGGPNPRSLISETLTRADEPAELLAYWHLFHGRNLPAGLKRGIADACVKLYTEFTALRYDGQSRAYRMGDVIELTHPKPSAEWQSQLFKYLVQRTHGDTEIEIGPELTEIAYRANIEEIAESDRRAFLPSLTRIESWEWLSGWLPGGMDAEAWEAAIPHMGYMALLRNLRNFDESGISDESTEYVINRLRDPEAVANSRQFPYRFWSAYKNAPSVNWARALEKALDLSTQNIPKLPGKTLVLTDTSGSMGMPASNRSNIARYEIAAVFAASMARACEDVTLVSWASSHTVLPFQKTSSVLRTVELVRNHINRDGMGTELAQALQTYRDHDRIVVFSDMQLMDRWSWRGGGNWLRQHIPERVPVHIYNLAGYAPTPFKVGEGNVYESGGFSDAAFRMLPLLERRSTAWPWEAQR